VLQIGYDRAVTAETTGLSDRQAVFASFVVPALTRGLQLEFTPRYTIVDSDVAGNTSNTNGETLKTLTLTLQATYQIARNISLIGSYTYYRQTTTDKSIGDIDQNRVFLGVQYAFPINFY
jgi:predicted porin